MQPSVSQFSLSLVKLHRYPTSGETYAKVCNIYSYAHGCRVGGLPQPGTKYPNPDGRPTCSNCDPDPTAESIFPPVSETDWVKGPASAKVTIIEYSDFQ
jgi:hypothetical protein